MGLHRRTKSARATASERTTAEADQGAERPVDESLRRVVGMPSPALAVIDRNGTVVVWSDGARQLLGHYPADVVGRDARCLMAREDAGDGTGRGGRVLGTPPWTKASRDGERPARAVVDLVHREGQVLRVSLEAVPMSDAEGRACWLVAATDTPDPSGQYAARGAAASTLLDRTPLAVAVWDARARCVWVNRATQLAMGLLDDGTGLAIEEAREGYESVGMESAIRRILVSGQPAVNRETPWISPRDGQQVRFSCTGFRLTRPDGTPLGVCTVSVDVTKSWARERFGLLGQAAKSVGTTLDVRTTAQELADIAVPALADYVTVDLAESVPLGREPLERVEPGDSGVPVFRRAGMASIHEGAPESAFAMGEPVLVPTDSPFMRVLHRNESYLEPVLRTGPGTWLDQDRTRTRIIRETGMHSLMMVPLQARGTVLGIAVFVRNENPDRFSRDDLLLAEEVAVQASLSLDNARRYTRERTAALALQHHLLPGTLRGGNAVDLATRYLPSDRYEGVGGDWLDAIPLPGGRIALVVGDVVGHGIHAAATMGRLSTAVQTLAALDQPPTEVLAHLDEIVLRLSETTRPGGPAPPIVGATCVYAVYDPATRICSLARAGHPPPLLVSPDGRVTMPDTPAGAPIGTGFGGFETVDLELPEGTLIALFTDGLIETRNVDIDAGINRLADALRHPPASLDALCSHVVELLATASRTEDDIALLIARTRSSGRR